MGRKSPNQSWTPHRLLRCCCDLDFQVRVLLAEVQVEILWEFSSRAVAVGISSSGREVTGGPDTPESISTSKFHFVPRASTVSRRLHCSPGGFLRTDLH